jgi:hypothetical protein
MHGCRARARERSRLSRRVGRAPARAPLHADSSRTYVRACRFLAVHASCGTTTRPSVRVYPPVRAVRHAVITYAAAGTGGLALAAADARVRVQECVDTIHCERSKIRSGISVPVDR